MKYFVKHFFAGVIILALMSGAAFAKVRKHGVTFPTDTTVNGTLVKAGDYDVTWDDQTMKLQIMKGHKLIAQATGELKDRTAAAKNTEMDIINNQLVSIAFHGDSKDIVVSSQAMQTGQ
jgi:hypothetical protein